MLPHSQEGVSSSGRHTNVDRSTRAGVRLDGNLTAHQLYSLSHADEPEAATVDGVLRIKANSQIAHGQLNFSRGAVQFHFELSRAAVLHRILQSFL